MSFNCDWTLFWLSAVVCCQVPGSCWAPDPHLCLVLCGGTLVWTVSRTRPGVSCPSHHVELGSGAGMHVRTRIQPSMMAWEEDP